MTPIEIIILFILIGTVYTFLSFLIWLIDQDGVEKEPEYKDEDGTWGQK